MSEMPGETLPPVPPGMIAAPRMQVDPYERR